MAANLEKTNTASIIKPITCIYIKTLQILNESLYCRTHFIFVSRGNFNVNEAVPNTCLIKMLCDLKSGAVAI